MTYILISLISLYIAFAGKIPKSRRTSGIFLLQFVLLLIAQLNFHFTKGVLAEKNRCYHTFIALMILPVFLILVAA